MAKRERTARGAVPGKRRADGRDLVLPAGLIELELVGVLWPEEDALLALGNDGVDVQAIFAAEYAGGSRRCH